MKKIIGISVAGLLAYWAASFLAANLIVPPGTKRWVLIGALWLIGLLAAVAIVWFLSEKKKQKEAPADSAPGSESGEIDALVKAAELKLVAAKAGHLGTLPIIFVIGAPGSTKTSAVLNSGLEVESLAGQANEGGPAAPTTLFNLWLAKGVVIAEFGGKLLADVGMWRSLNRRLQPAKLGSIIGSAGQAPRAALICFDIEALTQPGAKEAAVGAARDLRQKLVEISEKLGINLPVYALFTKMDRVPFFMEFVRNLGKDDIRQVVGASLPFSPPQPGAYVDQQTGRLEGAFDDLLVSLYDSRPDLLSRENDVELRPAVYEFPREFRKLRSSVVAFLVELCRPSQLTTSPFLRGFYFSGIRPIIVNDSAPAARPAPAQQQTAQEIGATRIMRIGFQNQPAAPPVEQQFVGSRKVPQWVFLNHLFDRVLLADRLAMGASAASTKTSVMRRVLLITASAICLILALGWTVSYFKNRALESDVQQAAQLSAVAEPAGLNVASLDSLRGLESLRQSLAKLGTYKRDGAPFMYHWGLYVGDDLYPQIYKLYFTRFRQVLLVQTQNSMVEFLRRLPVTPGPDYGPTYDTLKAYLITTSNHEKSTREFLAPVLLDRWSTNRNVDGERMTLARKQFEFYSGELKEENPFAPDNDAAAIGRARTYLGQFAAFERVYRAMLGDAAKSGPSLNFNRQFPGSAETVVDAYEVAAPFTKPGWAFMRTALKNPEKYFAGEDWVLGAQSVANFDRTKLAQTLADTYYADFIKQWRAYLKAASVVRYAGLADAAKKLGVLSGNQSPLLALFWLASQNTAVDLPDVANALQPVQAVVPPTSVDRYIAAPNQDYINAMVTLQASVEGVAAQPTGNDAGATLTLTNATAAKVAARRLAQTFRIDPETHIETQVQKLMEDPITYLEGLLRNLGPDELNGKGKGLCTQYRTVLNKYPFNSASTVQATIADVNGIFHRPDGAIWKFYDENLPKLLPKQGAQYVPASVGGVNLTPAFVAFFNQAAQLTDFLYSGNTPDPHIAYTLKPVPAEGIQTVGLRLDGQTSSYSGGDVAPRQIVWQAGGTHDVKATVKFGGGPDLAWASHEGLWSIFQFFNRAETWKPSGNGNILEWVIRIGKDPVTLPNGKPLTVRFELDMAGNPQVFQKGYFSKLTCVSDVAK